jgi:hypothetical protein
MHARPRRVAAVLLAVGIVAGSALALGAGASSSSAAPGSPPAVCAVRERVPAWFWHVLVIVLDLRCPPPSTTTTTTAAPATVTTTTATTPTTPTTATTPTTPTTGTTGTTVRPPTSPTSTTPPVSHLFRTFGTTRLVTCSGTPAAPVDCGPAVAVAGQVRVQGVLYTTDSNGHFIVQTGPPSGPFEVQAVLGAPPGRFLDCPVIMAPRPDVSVDPICRSFPAP